MKKVLKALGISVLYILLYLGVQTAVQLPPAVFFAVKIVLSEPQGTLQSFEAISEKLSAMMQSFVNITMLISALLTVGILFLIFVVRKKSFLRKVEWNRVSVKSLLPMALLGVSLNFLISTGLTLLPIPPHYFEGLEQMAKLLTSGNVWVDFAAIALAAPLVEEVIFRGCVFTTLKRNMPLPAALVVQAVLFGVLHVYAISIGYAVAVGILMAWAFVAYRSIWASLTLHIFFNAASFGARWLPETDRGITVGVTALSALLAAISLVFFIRIAKSRQGKGYPV